MSVRTRLAPSPTGYLHIGSLRTALYCYLWARHSQWEYIIRVEDTDRTRLVEWAVDAIFDMHDLLGIAPSESVRHGGEYGPYIQSERLHIYQPRLHKLCEEGSAYYCFCSSERLDALRTEQEELKLPPRYDGHCRHLPLEEAKERIKNGEKYTIRLKVPKAEKIVFNDLIRGRIEFNTSEVEDQVILKSDWFPTYHGAIVIDDEMMKISHVMRGEEWISSIPKQVLVARALWITLPEYAHLPNVLGADGKKLSKRTGDVSVSEYLKKWYLPEALLNFLSLLGWHPKQDEEIMSMDEMIEKFEITDIHKSGAVLDPIKLDWMNGEYIKRMELGELHSRLAKYLEEHEATFYKDVFSQKNYDFNAKIIKELQTRMRRFDEFISLTQFMYHDAQFRPELMMNPKMKIETIKEWQSALEFVLPFIENGDFSTIDSLKTPILSAIVESWKKNGQILWPLRIALSWEEFSPGAFELAYILWSEKSTQRIRTYLQNI
jgi:nondiscriminating glutamyl-tRNA synthetase